MELILTYTESRYGGAPIDPDDRWTDHEDEQIEWHPGQVFVDEPGKRAREKTKEWYVQCLTCDEPVKPGDKIWVVVVRYTTGCTFGRTLGAWHIEATFKNENKALHVADLIKKDDERQRKWCWEHPSYKRKASDRPPEDKYVSPHGYKCWQGYFESLEDVQVESFTVL
jgi:hypothetical protein